MFSRIKYLTVGAIPSHYAAMPHLANSPTVIADAKSYSWTEISVAAAQVADATASLGLMPQDRVLVLLPNCIEYVEIIYGLAQAGIVIVPLNPRLVAREIEFCALFSEAKCIITTPERCDLIAELIPRLPNLTTERLIVVGEPRPGFLSYPDLKSGARTGLSTVGRQPDELDVCWMPFTSGTTGVPKAALVRHRDLVEHWNVVVREFGVSARDTMLISGPFYHSLGFVFALACLYVGGRVVIQSAFVPDDVLRAVEQHRVTSTPAVPTMYSMLLALENRAAYDVSSMKTVISAGSPLLTGTKLGLLELFPQANLYEFYGSTEMGITAKLNPADQQRKVRSVGRPILGVDVRITDENGRVAPTGAVGEIWKRGLLLGPEYYANPEATNLQFDGEWMTAGDVGFLDDEGFLYIVDRKKDMIISGGANVYPSEVEEVLSRHPGVLEVAVIGIPDQKWGESILAVVVPRQGSGLTGETLLQLAVEQLSPEKRPRKVELVQALPKGGTGKILKRELREKYWAGHEARVN